MVRRMGDSLRERDQVLAIVHERCWPDRPQPRIGSIGLEVEMLPMRMANDGRPAGRVRLNDLARWLDDYAPQRSAVRGPPWRWSLPGRGDLTLEPGGQLEYSTRPQSTATAALDDVDRVCSDLANALGRINVALVSAGLDLWHPLPQVRQQLPHPRYQAMDAYFQRRGGRNGPGALMMRHTCSVQINVDLGDASVANERWLLANLLAPLLIGTFATSPVAAGASGRSLAWQALDPTRTGFPRTLRSRDGSPPSHLTTMAMRADVLCFARSARAFEPGRPGFRFVDWLRDGHPQYGQPTEDDLAYHLTTLWPEVRARGYLELRSIDALPARWRAVPVTVLAGVLCDDHARSDALAVLEPHRHRLDTMALRAARTGLADAALCALAVEVWSAGLEGARRLPAGWVQAQHLRSCEQFLDHFTLRGRCPADELREHLTTAPSRALAWAREPMDVPVGRSARDR